MFKSINNNNNINIDISIFILIECFLKNKQKHV